jgi:dTDP-4-dehydrorhamnose reductase
MRWTEDAWHIANQLRAEEVDVRAITSWALLGSHDWNTLLTTPGRYEPGAWDTSGGSPRETAMVPLLKGLKQSAPAHPVLAGAGWWRREIRLHHPAAPRPAPMREHLRAPDWTRRHRSPVLIVGATGTLGQAMAAACRHRGIAHVVTHRSELDLQDRAGIDRALERHQPWAVINAAGWVRVDDAEAAPEACMSVNGQGAAMLAEASDAHGIATVNFSSDLVFDGAAGRSYVEWDPPAPLNVYGHSKAEAERRIAALAGHHLIVRTAAFFSPFDEHNFAVAVVRALQENLTFRAAADYIVSPTYVPHLCNAVLDLAIDGADGIWHLTNAEAISWAAFGRRVAERCGLDPDLVEPVPGATLGWVARRPGRVALSSEKGRLLPTLGEAIDRFAEVIENVSTLRDEFRADALAGPAGANRHGVPVNAEYRLS